MYVYACIYIIYDITLKQYRVFFKHTLNCQFISCTICLLIFRRHIYSLLYRLLIRCRSQFIFICFAVHNLVDLVD